MEVLYTQVCVCEGERALVGDTQAGDNGGAKMHLVKIVVFRNF